MPQQRRRRNNVIEDGSEAEADPDAEAASDAAPMTEPAPASQESGVANAGGEEQESGVADAGGEEQEAEQAAADEADTGLDPTAAEQEDEGEDDADDATLSCDTDEGIRECLAEWHQSDGFLMSADPMKDIKISHLVDYCAFACGFQGADKAGFVSQYKSSIKRVWAQHRNMDTRQQSQQGPDPADDAVQYAPAAAKERDLTKKFKEDPDTYVVVDQCADPKVTLSPRGMLMYDNHDYHCRSHLMARHVENGGDAKGALIHGLTCYLRSQPNTKFVMAFMDADLEPHAECLVDDQPADLILVKMTKEGELDTDTCMHIVNRTRVPNKELRVSISDVIAYTKAVERGTMMALSEWDATCARLRILRQQDPAHRHIMSSGETGFDPMCIDRYHAFSDVRKLTTISDNRLLHLNARWMSANLRDIFVREKANIPRDKPNAELMMMSYLEKAVKAVTNHRRAVTPPSSILTATPTISPMGPKIPAPDPQQADGEQQADGDGAKRQHPSAGYSGGGRERHRARVTHEELPADFNNSPLSDSDRSTSTDNSMRTTRGEQLELKRLRRELENAEKQNEALKATNRKQGTDINNAKTNEKKASDARQVLKNQQATAKEEAKKLRIEVADLKDQLSRAESKLPKLEREKEVALKAKTTFQDQVKELKSASKDDAARMGLINDRNEELSKERDTARARIEALEARLYSEPPVQHQQPMQPQQPMMQPVVQPVVQPVERDTASWDTARARNEELSKERDAARARIEALEARLYSEPPVQHQQPMQPQQPMMQQPMMQPQQPMMQPQQPMMQQQQPMMMQQQPMMMQQHQPMMQPQQPVMHQQQPMMQGQQQQPQHLYWK
jgi:hypothetical protein